MNDHRSSRRGFVAALLVGLTLSLSSHAGAASAPAGFTPLFNGKDLTGWRGGDTYDHRKLLGLSPEDRKKQIDTWTKSMLEVDSKTGKPHWYGENDELVNDGHGAYATTEKDYGDFELLVDYKTVPTADSGIYLRGVPQVQIWDHTQADPQNLGRAKGSGGLWNNSPGAPGKDPLVMADKPFATRPDAVVLGADTVVVVRGERLGKPANVTEARAMLQRLHGRRHEVWTGLALIHGRDQRTTAECTVVRMARLSERDLEDYLATGESLDKAGAYGIQGLAGQFVKGIEGDYTNVVGLPLARLRALLEEFA